MAISRTNRRWDPFGAFDDLHEEMSRLLTSAFPDVSRISVNAWSPPVEVEETDDAYQIEADMPGVKPDDVSVELQGNELHIIGKIAEREHEGIQREQSRRAGEYEYRLSLPSEVASEGCEADLQYGVLRLRLPKTSTSQRRRIPIRASGGQEQLESSDSAKGQERAA